MLKKIVAIKNVGRFRNSATAGNPELAKHTLIMGANGYGKSTFCSVLRSLQTSDGAHLLGRRTLGISELPTVELRLAVGNARFDGAAWTSSSFDTAIFDGAFISENVHAGDIVEIDQKRNLYRVIIGEEGVKLAEEDADLSAQSRTKTGEVTAAERAIQPHLPPGITLSRFLALPPAPDIDVQIAEQERQHAAIEQAEAIRSRAALTEFAVPELPDRLTEILARTIDAIALDAETQLARHLQAHTMPDGSDWLAEGMDYANDTCPFCGQDIRGLPLIGVFRSVFSDGYKAHITAVAAMHTEVGESFGEAALARLETIAEQNRRAEEFWSRYCSLPERARELPADLLPACRTLRAAALALLEQKQRTPLQALTVDALFTAATAAYSAITAKITAANGEIRTANGVIAEKKATTARADLGEAARALRELKAIKLRHSPEASALCERYIELGKHKAALEARREASRRNLDEHTKRVVRPYEKRINALLDKFNTGFSIAETKHAYPGGVATSSYRLVINRTAIDVGDGRTPIDQPSFKNTLSAGDRTTLALAFFLASLEDDPGITGKVVVFDDPFSSQDAFRRLQTVHEIMRVAKRCAQVIVLSHDPSFLKQVWDKADPSARVALAISDHRVQGSKIALINLDDACRGRTATEIDGLVSYLATGAGEGVDIIKKMRVVLETYCRVTYLEAFQRTDWLGDIVRKIGEGGSAHPAHALYEELSEINDYTKQYHHGEDVFDSTPDQIDHQALTGFVKRTLRTVNALQA